MDRPTIEHHVKRVFNIHYKPALQRLSPEARRVLIFGWDASSANANRDQVRQEITSFHQQTANSMERSLQVPVRENIEE